MDLLRVGKYPAKNPVYYLLDTSKGSQHFICDALVGSVPRFVTFQQYLTG